MSLADQLVDLIQTKSGAAMPGTDLLLSNAYDELMSTVIKASHIGQGVVDGVECEHLAFRGVDTDWQIWIESGARPVPRKYVITSKTVTGAPQYTLRIKDWKTDAIADADAFVFKPPAGVTKVDLDSGVMAEFDELPRYAVRSKKMISSRKFIKLAAALAAFAAGLSCNDGDSRRQWSILRSCGKGRSAAHTDELCGGRAQDDAPRGCGWCCGRCRRCCGRLLWLFMRAGRGRLRSGHDALLTSSSGPVEAVGCSAQDWKCAGMQPFELPR